MKKLNERSKIGWWYEKQRADSRISFSFVEVSQEIEF